jgi:hypothetical protein
MKIKEEFQTDNLQLAGYITAKKIPLIKIERSGRFGLFFFPKKEADFEATNFISGQALIEPQSFVTAIRELRAAVDGIIAKG